MEKISHADKDNKDRKIKKEILMREFIRVGDVVSQNKMVLVNVRDFFNNFRLLQNETSDGRAAGGVIGDGESQMPIINIPWDSMCWYNKRETLRHYNKPEMQYKNSDDSVTTVQRVLNASKEGKWLYPEYSNFCNDPEIGDYFVTSIRETIRLTMAHEMAHALQFWNCEPGYDEGSEQDGHNEVWKKDYRILRKALGLVRK